MLSVDMAYTVDSELSSGTSDLCLLLSPTKLNQLMKTTKLTKKIYLGYPKFFIICPVFTILAVSKCVSLHKPTSLVCESWSSL